MIVKIVDLVKFPEKIGTYGRGWYHPGLILEVPDEYGKMLIDSLKAIDITPKEVEIDTVPVQKKGATK